MGRDAGKQTVADGPGATIGAHPDQSYPGKPTNLRSHRRPLLDPGDAKTRRSGSKSGPDRWSQWDEIGWVHYPEIGWSHSGEIRWVQSLEILQLSKVLPRDGLHFAFLDPYSLGSLSYELLRSLGEFRRMDILVLISAMDLFRNIDQQSSDEAREFDEFAPAWREHVPIGLPQPERRALVMEYWAWRVRMELGLDASSEMHPVKNSVNRLIYWLLLLHRHQLAKKFWDIVLKGRPQRTQEMPFGE